MCIALQLVIIEHIPQERGEDAKTVNLTIPKETG